jgi:ArsR family transcriptional regulator
VTPWDELNASVCKALTHPVRIQILGLLREGEMAVGDICRMTGRTQPNISQHLNVMRTKGFVSASRRGSKVYYRLTDLKLVRALDLIRDVITAGSVRHRKAQELP